MLTCTRAAECRNRRVPTFEGRVPASCAPRTHLRRRAACPGGHYCTSLGRTVAYCVTVRTACCCVTTGSDVRRDGTKPLSPNYLAHRDERLARARRASNESIDSEAEASACADTYGVTRSSTSLLRAVAEAQGSLRRGATHLTLRVRVLALTCGAYHVLWYPRRLMRRRGAGGNLRRRRWRRWPQRRQRRRR